MKQTYSLNKSGSSSRSRKKTILMTLVVVVVIAACLFILEKTGVTHFLHKESIPVDTGGQYTKGQRSIPADSQASNPSNQPTNQDSQPGDTKHQTTDTSAPLIAPTGTFANVYQAKTSDQMGSTCNTTPGATCQIIFTNGTLTKSLSAQVADRGGAVYWAWKPQDIGLTKGTWHITARAVLGSQTKTTSDDPLTLEIQ